LQASIVAPDGEATLMEMTQTAPGRYQTTFVPTVEGAYLIRVNGANARTGVSVGQTTGWVLAYSPEYRVLQADPYAVARLAWLTGGDALSQPERAFRRDLAAQRDTRPVWPWLLLVAALLLPLDVAIRRLMITRHDLQHGLARLYDFASALRPPSPARIEHEPTSRLMAAKLRATRPARAEEPPSTMTPSIIVHTPPDQPAKPITATPATPVSAPPSAASAPSTATEPRPQTDTATALLARKRARRGDRPRE
jgi:hypothetical protein